MPTSSPAIHPSRGIHSATTDWNRLTNPRRVRSILGWLPLRQLQVTWEMTQACDSLPPKASNLGGLKKQFLG
jgi:hypothetical protein